MAKQHSKSKSKETEKKPENPKLRKLFAECGRPYNLNEPKLTFNFENCHDRFVLDLHIYKYFRSLNRTQNLIYNSSCLRSRYLETSLLNVDVQPNYVRVTVKGKVFQLALSDEVNITESSTQRSTLTGHLAIVMPKLLPSRQLKSIEENKTGSKSEDGICKLSSPKDRKMVSYKDLQEICNTEIPPLC